MREEERRAMMKHPLDGCRGIMLGVMLSLPMWIILVVFVLWLGR